jgi:hypothetical protein
MDELATGGDTNKFFQVIYCPYYSAKDISVLNGSYLTHDLLLPTQAMPGLQDHCRQLLRII